MPETATQASMRMRYQTIQREIDAHEAGVNATEPHRRMMMRLINCCSPRITIMPDGSAIIDRYDDETERLLAELRLQADCVYRAAFESVTGRSLAAPDDGD